MPVRANARAQGDLASHFGAPNPWAASEASPCVFLPGPDLHPAHLVHPPPCPQECHCMLFLTEDNDFSGQEQDITLEEVVEATEGM